MIMNIGFWKVLGLCWPAVLTQMVKEIESRNMEITAIQEIRCTGEGIVKTMSM